MSSLSLFALAVNLLAVLAITGLFTNAGKLFGPKSVHQGDADMPYETGLPPLSPAHERMTVLYHRFAVLFVVFDVDLAFVARIDSALDQRTFAIFQRPDDARHLSGQHAQHTLDVANDQGAVLLKQRERQEFDFFQVACTASAAQRGSAAGRRRPRARGRCLWS